MSSIDQNNFFRMTFDRNTFIGFDHEEIEKTSTNDLLTIRRAVYDYLKSTKLKKRNANFIDVFRRMTEELQKRNVLPKRDKKRQNRQGKEKLFRLIKKNETTHLSDSSTSKETTSQINSVKSEKNCFLNKKMRINVEIPSFFNDKVQKRDTAQKVLDVSGAENLNQIIFHKNLKNIYNENFINKNYISYSDKPVFMSSKTNDDLFFPSPGEDFESGLRDIELRSAMFNEISEDMFFVLD